MTGFKDCLTTAAVRGLLTEGKAGEALKLFDDMVEELKAQGISDASAAEKAAKMATDQVRYEVARRKELLVLSNTARNRIEANLLDYRNMKGEASPGEAALALLEGDQLGRFSNYEDRTAAITGSAHSRMEAVLTKFQPQKAGIVRPTAGLDNMVREALGQETKDVAAKELATAWRETTNYLRERANAAGAAIPKRDDWGLPHTHDRLRIAKAGKKSWVDFVLPRVDFNRMFDAKTGRTLGHLAEEERRVILGEVFDTIKTDGYVKLDSKSVGGGKMLANRMSQHRFLQFADGDGWLQYNEKFGSGTAWDAMINHIDGMSRQISMLETFGPNPEMMRRHIKQFVRQQAGLTDAARSDPAKRSLVDEQEKQLRKFDSLWAIKTNQNAMLNGDWMGHTLAGVRNILTSSLLGSASLTAIPGDFLSVRFTKKFNKMQGTKFIRHYAKLMNPASDADRRTAVRLGLIAEAATSLAFGQQRLLGQITGPQFTRRIADTIMRVTLMTPHTQAGRWAFGMEALGTLADYAGKGFDEMPLKDMFKRHSITAEDWDIIRKTPIHDEDGATFLRPDDIAARTDLLPSQARALADKVHEMVISESRVAIQEPTDRARMFLLDDTKPGTFIGELGRSAAMFKNFAVTVQFIHWRRNMLNHAMGGSKYGYIASFGIGLTMMGALSTQMRQMSQGKDPLNMNPASPEGRQFWGNAALAGGGLGIWGDFLFRDTNRYGGGLLATAAGPVVGFAADATKLTAGNLLEAAQGKDTKIVPESVAFLRRYMPGTSVWYSRLILQRMIFDQLQEAADPRAHEKWRQQKRQMRKDYKQDFWWGPGQTSPSRSPDLSEAAQ